MRRAALLAVVLLAACADEYEPASRPERPAVTVTTGPAVHRTAPPPAAPITLSGAGQQNTDPLELGGSYVVAFDFAGDCYYAAHLVRTDGEYAPFGDLASGSGPVSGTNNTYDLDNASYYVRVITGPPPECPWSLTLTPR